MTFGPTGVAKRQGILHVVVVSPLAVLAVLLLPSAAGMFTVGGCALAAWMTSRPFLRPIRVSGELLVRGHDRVGTQRVVTPVRVGVRATIGLQEAIFVPIVFPESGRSLSLWSLASSSESEAEAWVSRIFGGRDVILDEELHG